MQVMVVLVYLFVDVIIANQPGQCFSERAEEEGEQEEG
jgi:hypothetical protein